MGVELDAVEGGTFDHHSRQRLGSGEAHQDAAGVAELGFGAADFPVDEIQLLKRAAFLARARSPGICG